jgi:catechol 2,3-dioxygenase-like lactoylglutathione lyase family enzyme
MHQRGIDHLVLAVHDLDAAARFYENLGFIVGVRNRHPWGTENRIVQFPHIFLELITVGQDADIAPHHHEQFSFGAFIQEYLAQREGFAMLVLTSNDAEKDRAEFADKGIGGFAPFSFERQGQRPDGSTVKVAFTLAFARDVLAPDIGYFVCQHHYPENFWNATAQAHPNQVKALTEVALYADNPADHAEFMSHFTGLRDYSATSSSIHFSTRGAIQIYSKPAFSYFYGQHDDITHTQLAGFTLSVSSLDDMIARCKQQSIDYEMVNGALVIAPKTAYGVGLRFVADH